jgi:hypothetical protein
MTTDNFLQKQQNSESSVREGTLRQCENPPPVAGLLTDDNQCDLLAIRTEDTIQLPEEILL